MKAFLRTQKNHMDVAELFLSKEEAKQLKWEDETEFRYKNEMYDLIEKKTMAHHVILRCIADRQETILLKEYQKNTSHSTSASFIFQLITTIFILPSEYSLTKPEGILENLFDRQAPSLKNLTLKILLPPPDGC